MSNIEIVPRRRYNYRVKDIPGFEGRYAVNKQGGVWSYGSKRYLKPYLSTFGYPTVKLKNSEKYRHHRVHRLVMLTLATPDPLKTDVNHINGIKTDNRIENLEWCTHLENMNHAHTSGLIPQKRVKLTEDLVIEIRTAFSRGDSFTSIHRKFPINKSSVHAVIYGRTWRNVAPELIAEWRPRKHPLHGTHSRYCKGCRCSKCTRAHREYNRIRKGVR